jgi:hypothetical protein
VKRIHGLGCILGRRNVVKCKANAVVCGALSFRGVTKFGKRVILEARL